MAIPEMREMNRDMPKQYTAMGARYPRLYCHIAVHLLLYTGYIRYLC